MQNNREKLVLDLIDKTSGSSKYQTVELDGKVVRYGSEKCWITWENITKLDIDFKDKTVYDIGCFNGYFSFKIMKSGAKEVIGIDSNLPAVNIYNYICELYKYNNCKAYNKNALDCNFINNRSNVTLCLNVLHHIKRADGDKYLELLKYIFNNSDIVIVEVNEAEIPDLDGVINNTNFKMVNKIKSHRNTMFGQRYVICYKLVKN
ncbi:tRNA mo(5)U34 methyltransferase [Fadolivirus algeromassiliense]|jgi:2-polyprenyl-3-methyl-5-hydroxy-6-metoxy-1,4-benzoquinol methylase|uniref:tRNA mo(5)U34 methyltransferase n=1 Tax=Fadolivirus FV1/VV64 TaxID=3070911 RepID=A0A7D3V5K7_9VIRU|nr:tRNA mo(5)U34 methyltransferase [Fadolivirus algeromassiliense]QKF94155.1 tRNA mo(5)U34 methyltransferase [Fadolivirus FV1/VV64]